MTRLTNLTPFGAGFTLKRPTEKGRLLHMTIPMPRQLRVFDHVEDQYRVWSVVRYLKAPSDGKGAAFNVGVAFIGKRAPASYQLEPWKRYEISTSAFQTLAYAEDILKTVSSADQRTQTRHSIAVDMRLEVVNETGTVVEFEQTVTENISSKGAVLFTTLQIPQGRFIRLTSEQYGMCVYAAIRSLTTGDDGLARIHVEFIDREWPL